LRAKEWILQIVAEQKKLRGTFIPNAEVCALGERAFQTLSA
jgi:hypothetical protein